MPVSVIIRKTVISHFAIHEERDRHSDLVLFIMIYRLQGEICRRHGR